MKIVALDDNGPALNMLVSAICEARPKAEVSSFSKASELLVFANENVCDIAFLDIEMWGMSGLEVAKRLKNINPTTNIIFVTAHSKYAGEAFSLYPSGYILKPATKEAVEREIENLRHPICRKNQSRIYVQTYGNFEVLVDGAPLKFKYSKTKELLAYLIDRNGAAVNTNEICAVLWEDNHDSLNVKAYLRKLVSDLTNTLKAVNAEDILYKRRNSFAILPDKFFCDSYGFAKYDPESVNAYSGEYMAQYSWAEMTTGTFNEF